MGTVTTKTPLNTWPSETRNVLRIEIEMLDDARKACADPATLLILDFLEADQDHSELALELTLTLSARFAAATGLSQRQWLQQVLSRHASHLRALEALWQALITLNINGGLPWAAS